MTSYCQIYTDSDASIDRFFLPPDSLNISKIFFENGELDEEGEFVKNRISLFYPKVNLEEGLWKSYYEVSGALKSRGTYHKGKKDGLWEFYDKQGCLMRVVLYKGNRVVDKRIYIKEIPIWEQEKFKNKKGVFIAD